MNYWAPLQDTEDQEQVEETEKIATIQPITTIKSNKWIRRKERREAKKLVIDSGATSHFVTEEMNLPINGKSYKEVYLPNDMKIQATHKTKLPFIQLTNKAREAEILPGLKTSLMSVNKLAEEGYTTIFHPGEKGATIHKPGTLTIKTTESPILQGCKNKGEKLWTITSEEYQDKEQANNVYDLPSIKQVVKYLHAAAGFPVAETWIKAIKAGNYNTWPTISPEIVRRHFPESSETQKGHMKKQRQGVRSTRVLIETKQETNTHTEPKMKDIYIKIHNATETMHSDQTGRFPATSSKGNKYIMVLVEVDGNYIDAEPMKDKSTGSMIKTYLLLWNRLTDTGTVKPKTHIMDNEVSEDFKKEIRKNCTIQLVPPDNHRRNLAERAIQTFKNHFKAIIAGVDDSFPMSLWDRLLPQAVLTLNLLRQANAVPTISAYQYVHGNFDYNKTPLAPMGCKVQIHESKERRGTWAPNSTDGWYLQTSLEHYRCYVIYVKQTKNERISDTVYFKTKYITQPTLTDADVITKALNDLSQALKRKNNTKGLEQIEALKKIEDILNNSPKTKTISKEKQVTFAQNTKPPAETKQNHTKNKLENKLREQLRIKTMERMPKNNMQLRRSTRILQQAQLIYDKETKTYLNYRQLISHPKYKQTWNKSAANEFGRLAQGLKDGRVKGTNTIKFIKKDQVPTNRKKDVTYGSFNCDYRPGKEEEERTRLTVGGDRINYPDDCGTPTADMTLFKIHVNSILSTPGAKCLTMDIKDFYLNSPMKRPEYMKLKITDIPEEIIQEYNLKELVTQDGYVYCEITKGMYGLPQAGILAQELLEKRLAKEGYKQSKIINGFWKHKTRPISFTLVVDDFAVKYVKEEDAEHLINTIKKYYPLKIDKKATKYIGLTIEWDYKNRKAHISMPGYIQKALIKFKHEKPKKTQNSPHPHVLPQYGTKIQYAKDEEISEPLSKEETKYVQAVVGTLLYYARAVDSTILTSLSSIATEQAKPTKETMKKVKQLLDYCATQEDAVITYNASNMILAVHSDAGYCNEKNARSRAGGHFFISKNEKYPPNNGAILTNATIIKAVMSSAAEAELGALFINAQDAVYLRQILNEMGHAQPRTPIQTDNTTAEGVINNRIQPKRTKAMDMRFHWLRDREAQGQFRIYWRPGGTNLADYYTKHHPPAHHVNVRAEFLTRLKERSEAREGQTE